MLNAFIIIYFESLKISTTGILYEGTKLYLLPTIMSLHYTRLISWCFIWSYHFKLTRLSAIDDDPYLLGIWFH